MTKIPAYDDLVAATRRIKSFAVKTQLIENPLLNEITGARVFIKPENLQITGSFKFRGALNAISVLKTPDTPLGIVAVSSGNHAQGIAEAARLLGAKATIVMPSDAPRIKLQRTRRSGAKIITYERHKEDRYEIARTISAKKNAAFIHPYDDFYVIAGQGTVGVEIAEQLAAQNLVPDRVLCCTGGGGLTSGVALAIHHNFPKAKIHSVEPVNFDDYRRSLLEGHPVENLPGEASICDAILTEKPGDIGFAINSKILAEGLTVSDEQALAAVKFAFHELKLVVEPGGAVALAALLNADKTWSGQTIACIISGGNIDADMLATALAG